MQQLYIGGHQFTLDFTVDDFKRIRNATGWNPLKENAIVAFEELTDIVLLADVTWAAIEEQADGKLNRKEFSREFRGMAIAEAMEKIPEAVIDFFPNPERQNAARELMKKFEEAGEIASQRTAEKLSALTPEEIAEMITGGKSTTSPGSSESTPEDIHSES